MSVWGKSKSNDTVLSDSQIAYIRNVNKLDWELYEYAVQLFDERVERLRRELGIRRWDGKKKKKKHFIIAVCLLYSLDLLATPIIMILNNG